MTARERNQYFSDFMSKVMEAPTAVYPNTPGTPAFTGPPPELQYPGIRKSILIFKHMILTGGTILKY